MARSLQTSYPYVIKMTWMRISMTINENTKNNYSSADKVEDAFYKAFEEGNLMLMKGVFADENFSYSHPSSPLIMGRDDAIQYWEFLLTGINKTSIQRTMLNKVCNDNLEIHLVSEVTEFDDNSGRKSETITSNTYVKQSNGWRLQMQHSTLSGEIVDTSNIKQFEEIMNKVIPATLN